MSARSSKALTCASAWTYRSRRSARSPAFNFPSSATSDYSESASQRLLPDSSARIASQDVRAWPASTQRTREATGYVATTWTSRRPCAEGAGHPTACEARTPRRPPPPPGQLLASRPSTASPGRRSSSPLSTPWRRVEPRAGPPVRRHPAPRAKRARSRDSLHRSAAGDVQQRFVDVDDAIEILRIAVALPPRSQRHRERGVADHPALHAACGCSHCALAVFDRFVQVGAVLRHPISVVKRHAEVRPLVSRLRVIIRCQLHHATPETDEHV